MSHSQLRVGGVPEYFTLPWHVALENQAFADQGVDVLWKDYPGGTGAMMQDLREEKLDVAVALTEGVVAEIVNRQSCRMVQYFVTSPLTWGIYVAAPTSFREVGDLLDHPFAISRPGSGSHLMTYVLAQRQGWPTDQLQFREAGNLTGAIKALAANTAVGFLWEKLTTQPWVDNGEFRRVGTIDTPWPCFVIAARSGVVNDEALASTLAVLNRTAATVKQTPGVLDRVIRQYGLPPAEAKAGWEKVQWATDPRVERVGLERVIRTLRQLAIVSKSPEPEQLCGGGCQLV